MDRSKVLICDDHPVFRYGLKTLIEKNGCLVFEAADASEAVEAAKANAPDVFIVDYILPETNGLQLIETIRETAPHKTYILLTSIYEPEFVQKCREMNLDGYISKEESLETIGQTVAGIIAGERLFLEPAVKDCAPVGSENPFHLLTQREIEIVREVVSGKTHRHISKEMGISIRTVDKHRENISRKLGKLSLPELTRKAFVWGLVDGNGLAAGKS